VAVAALLVVVLAIVAVLAVSWVRRPFPATDGELAIAGLTGTVEVIRGEHGIPQIYADTPEDLFRAQGFVHAQDRFFQMDVRRHITAGRLSEMVGESGLETDRVVRTLGWRRVAEKELPTLATETRRYLQAYADGVNAYIRQSRSPSEMALEYVVLSRQVPEYRVEDWTPADSLAWLKAMAWDLRSDYGAELMRARLAGQVSMTQLNELWPPYPYDTNKPILSAQDWSPAPSSPDDDRADEQAGSAVPPELTTSETRQARQAYAAVQRALDDLPVLVGRGDGIGSNSWVVSGSRTSTGKPLLANDPHLGVGIPSIWHQVGLHCRTLSSDCPFDVSGYSFAGLPGVVIGHNQSIAWGFTNLAPDVSDFFLEQVRGGTYLRDGEQVPLDVRRETIKIAGGGEETISVRSTVHGPLLSDSVKTVDEAGDSPPVNGRQSPGSYEVALQWTGIQVSQTADAIFGLNRATNWTEFREAAMDFAVPSQNLVYADTTGNIGYQAPGMVPVRSRYMEAAPGFWIRPGWVSTWDWKGYVPFDEMPWTFNPPEQLIVTANQAVTQAGSPFLTSEWDYGYRAQRIRSVLDKDDDVTPADMSRLQGDTHNQFAPTLVKALLDVKLEGDDFTQSAQDLLRTWKFTQPVGNGEEAAAAAYYNAVWSELLDLTFNDELPLDLRAKGGDQWMQAFATILDKPRSGWWDDKRTAGVTEGQSEILRMALAKARLKLTEDLGKDPSDWEWGKLHQLTLRHPVLGGDGSPGPVQRLFNRGPVELPGGSAIVNANGWDASQGFEVNWAPSMRMVVDLSDLDASRWVNQTGTSGHTWSEHYNDQNEAWARNELFDWPFTRKAVDEAGGDTLTLVPGES
jgi:penicillin G amidase